MAQTVFVTQLIAIWNGAIVDNAGNYFIIHILKYGINCVFDPMNIYLRFKWKLIHATSDVPETPASCIWEYF